MLIWTTPADEVKEVQEKTSCNIAGPDDSSMVAAVSVTSVKRRSESSQEGGAGKEMINALLCFVIINYVHI